MRKVRRETYTWPAYRWTCIECDALETFSGPNARRDATRGAREHTADTGHETDLARLVAGFSSVEQGEPG